MLCDALFVDTEPLNKKTTLIVFDTSWVAHASALAKAYNWMSYENKFSGHVFGFMAKVMSVFRAYGKLDLSNTELIFVFDEKPVDTYALYPEYKGGRHRVFDPVADIKNLVNLFSCKHAYAAKTEADHVIGSIVYNCHNTHNVYVISRDNGII